jgi:hypothetical protein
MKRTRPVFAVLVLLVPAGAGVARAQDEVILRAQPEKPIPGKFVQESPHGIKLADRADEIPADQILDVYYDIPRDISVKSYRAAQQRERSYLTTRPAAERRTALAEALKYYQATRAALAKVAGHAAAKRHLAYKEAELRLWQAREENDSGKLQLALDALKAFIDAKDGRDGWQAGRALMTLARQQVEMKEYAEAEKTYRSLADLSVADDLRDAARARAAAVPRYAKKVPDALARVKKLTEELPPGRRGMAQVVYAECLAADKRLGEAVTLLNKVITETKDARLKARAYNALGRCYLDSQPPDPQNLHEARWAFLFVDLIYRQDADEQAEALYHLDHIFRTLNEPERARECVDELLADRRFLGSEYLRRALREQK